MCGWLDIKDTIEDTVGTKVLRHVYLGTINQTKVLRRVFRDHKSKSWKWGQWSTRWWKIELVKGKLWPNAVLVPEGRGGGRWRPK